MARMGWKQRKLMNLAEKGGRKGARAADMLTGGASRRFVPQPEEEAVEEPVVTKRTRRFRGRKSG